jgi:subtilisin family serine protease
MISRPRNGWCRDFLKNHVDQAFNCLHSSFNKLQKVIIMKAIQLARVIASGILGFSSVVLSSVAVAQAVTPLAAHPFAPSKPIIGQYIGVFKAGVGNPAAETDNLMRGRGGRLHHVYANSIKGFAATLPEAALQAIRNNPNVDYIEADHTVSLQQTSPQNQATWGLDRIDQADRPLSGQYTFNSTGAGVTAFIIDTGIRADHVEFAGRMKPGYNTIADTNGTNDCNGHGTHVAGTVGGTTWGVAKGVTLVPVRVLDCAGSGSWSGVIAGIDWVAASALRPAVANMSLSGSVSSSINAAVAGAVGKGVTMVVAAGNSNADACNYSPSSAPGAITVGATDSNDARASYSNYGSCVDIFAPGSNITSATKSSATATSNSSGTSMASPHVAGVAALVLAASPAASPAAVATFLTTNAKAGRLRALGTGSKNLLAYSMAAGAPAEPLKAVVAVKSLTGKSTKTGKNWKASVTVSIRDINSGAGVANATVNGSFSPGGASNCVTSTTGNCTMSSPNLNRATSASVLTVTNVSGTNLTYDSNQNSAAQIMVSRP